MVSFSVATSTVSPQKYRDLEYVKDDYKYIDTYLGGENFIGEEAVFYLDKPIWGMNYYGKEYEKNCPSKIARA